MLAFHHERNTYSSLELVKVLALENFLEYIIAIPSVFRIRPPII